MINVWVKSLSWSHIWRNVGSDCHPSSGDVNTRQPSPASVEFCAVVSFPNFNYSFRQKPSGVWMWISIMARWEWRVESGDHLTLGWQFLNKQSEYCAKCKHAENECKEEVRAVEVKSWMSWQVSDGGVETGRVTQPRADTWSYNNTEHCINIA